MLFFTCLNPGLTEKFSKILKNKSVKILNRNTCNNFLNTISEQNSKNIIKWLIENSSPDREIDIQESYIKDIEISVRDDTFFNIAYDCDFLGSNKEVIMKNYRFIIIDGFLESIGEIHHLLHYAAESKEPHVIFCFGMSEEVKSVIIENNTRGITKIKCHIKYLQKRINDTNAGMNTDIIKTRIKNIKSKSLTIFINKTLSKNSLFNRSLDYGLRMLKNSNQPYYLIDLENKKIMVPTPIYSFLNKKVNMTKKLFYNIEKSVLISNKE